MNEAIFKEYDIRGIVDKDFDADDVYLIGRAFGSVIVRDGAKTVCTTYDGRESSPLFAERLNQGLMDCGLHVIDTGLGATPMNYFSICDLNTDAGVMITASHNPREYNGMKPSLAKAVSFFGDDIKRLKPIIKNKDFVDGEGSIEKIYMVSRYVERLIADLDLKKDLKVVWDNGNGASGEILKTLLDKLPGEHILMYGDIDGTFPNHHPDPSNHKNLKDLQDKVLEIDADLGVAFDGDGDRVGVVTNKGEIIDNDIVLAMFAREELKKYPGQAVVGDVKCSKVFFDKVEEWGGNAVMIKTGHVHSKTELKKLDGVLAGEISGHMIFNKGYYGFDDGLYAAIKMLNLVSNSDIDLSSLLAEYPKTDNTPETRIEVPEEEKFEMVEKIKKAFEAKPEFDIIDIDGVRATNEDGIIMFRASNTQNLLSIRCESLTGKESLNRLLDLLIEELVKIGVNVTRDTFA